MQDVNYLYAFAAKRHVCLQIWSVYTVLRTKIRCAILGNTSIAIWALVLLLSEVLVLPVRADVASEGAFFIVPGVLLLALLLLAVAIISWIVRRKRKK